ncbi:hypothetical protein CN689_26410 [Peribacillus butanolivorans]|uniref:Uncharacterized protein n=1 Tax=Peribacillus butanolivorans TaxID=421767 RepID=A0AAX0RXK8_9BACI|nr:hypothetical protein [Peribacillus butanolivorans]PEJ25045.1 hypothetical protein CN689_26410 [Peribacillus butanolivorans]
MAKTITTGPMVVPFKMTGDPVGSFPDILFITIKNHTDKTLQASSIVSLCPSLNAIGTETDFPPSSFLLTPKSCGTVGFLGYVPDNVLRVTVTGDVDLDATVLEVTVFGRRISDGMHEPTMYFRHHDFVPVK